MKRTARKKTARITRKKRSRRSPVRPLPTRADIEQKLEPVVGRSSMTSEQFRELLGRLLITQKEMAKLLGANERTARRWARKGINGAAAILLHLVDRGVISVDQLHA